MTHCSIRIWKTAYFKVRLPQVWNPSGGTRYQWSSIPCKCLQINNHCNVSTRKKNNNKLCSSLCCKKATHSSWVATYWETTELCIIIMKWR